MDQRFLDQLNALERGARIAAPPARSAYDNSSAEFSAYDVPDDTYDTELYYKQDADFTGHDFVDQPMTLDSFDQQLLQQPDYNSRRGQAALGRARLSLASEGAHVNPRDMQHGAAVPQMQQYHPVPSNFGLSRLALDSGQPGMFSSSPGQQQLPSSPTFRASQRRPVPVEHSRGADIDFGQSCEIVPPQQARYQNLDMPHLSTGRSSTQPMYGEPGHYSQAESRPTNPICHTRRTNNGAPVVQGISLVSTQDLPDRFRDIFPYPLFNAVQSKCFDAIYKTNDNLVLSAPTGSGKTVLLELAICRLIDGFANGSYKIVYQAPTKSLCSERQRDWQAKFGPLDLQCAELTGDTDHAQLRNVQHASIIITTPEKWDSMTRKWKDHQKLMQMVKLFLIDEVHILKEDRGATLEAVVSRMKSVGSNVRFVALSATVPNSQDIATWLGKDSNTPEVPAVRERFGEDFRPVRLQKHVCGYQSGSNEFGFEKTLNGKLPEVIAKYSQKKPIMIFCFTRAACVDTAKVLAGWWNTKGPRERYWTVPRKRINVADKDLQETIPSGVAFHHAGLDVQDRNAVEKGYIEGEIQVICSTSTLAVGVNLPCHMVIIKNTVAYQSAVVGGCKEYSDLEIMQMLGRAGRPQFDNSAVAIIMTRLQRVSYYEKMITGQEILESCLHRNLIDHLNAEIGLGTIYNASSAKKWLMGTFLYVRLKDNPEHYKIEGDVPGRTLDERLENICEKGIALLEEYDLIMKSNKLQCTEYGDAMARYYLQFDTMKIFLDMSEQAKVSEVLSRLAQAAEFKDIRFRAGEKRTYNDLNKNSSIKYPISVHLDASAHKISLIIQAVLGAVDFPTEDHKQRAEYNTAKTIIFQHAHRLIRCIVDCHLYRQDAVTARNALMLARSLGAQVWDDSPLHVKQLEGVGPVAVRKLVSANIRSFEDIDNTDAHRLECVLSRNPPYGAQLQEKARAFPKLRISINVVGEPAIKKGESVKVNLKAEIGFLNEKVPEVFHRKAVYVCLIAETSDGKLLHFARISAKKLNKGQDVRFSADLTSATQSIRAYVMCDELAGTLRHVNLNPGITAGAFPQRTIEASNTQASSTGNVPNTAKRRASVKKVKTVFEDQSDEFGDEDIDDADLAQAEFGGFVDIDDFDDADRKTNKPNPKKRKRSSAAETNANDDVESMQNWEPQQLANGNWVCNHPCKDKTKCRHICCREGLEKKPKPPKTSKARENKKEADPGSHPKQTQLSLSTKKAGQATQDSHTVRKTPAPARRKPDTSREASELNRLHNSIKTKTPKVPKLGNHPSDDGSTWSGVPEFSFLRAQADPFKEDTSDYGNEFFDSNDLPSMSALVGNQATSRMTPPKAESGRNGVNDDMLIDVEDDLSDGDFSQALGRGQGDGYVDLSSYTGGNNAIDEETSLPDDPFDEMFDAPMPSTVRPAKAKQNSFGPAANNPALSLGAQQKPNTSSKESSARTKRQRPTAHTPSIHFPEEQENADRPFPADNFLAHVVEDSNEAASQRAAEEEDSNNNELRALFEREFGTELFNLTGF